MTTPRITVDGVKLLIAPSAFKFVRQTCVKFYGKRLSKNELIKCCDYFISELKQLYSIERLKIGFNLKSFNYYELSVYLHGLISLLCSNIDCLCPSCFGLFRFSHLPHEILIPEKKDITIQCAKLGDPFGGSYFCCVISCIALCSQSLEDLAERLKKRFPNFAEGCDIHFVLP